MDKKGVMIKFLMGILIALIVFIPACITASKFFRLSDQAKTNFVTFVDTLKVVEKKTPPYEKTALLILDEGTAMVYWESDKNIAILNLQSATFGRSLPQLFSRPPQCDVGKGCLCLLREVDPGEETAEGYTVEYSKQLCDQVETPLQLNSCEFGQGGAESVSCQNGFVIQRFLPDATVSAKAPRRLALHLIRQEDRILLTQSGT